MPTSAPRFKPRRVAVSRHLPPSAAGRHERHHHLYNNSRWRKARIAFLSNPEHAICRDCKTSGRIEPSTDVHHEPDHGGDYERFWDESCWVGLCHSCHSRITARGR